MRFTWESSDIKPGRIVVRNQTEKSIIGYHVQSGNPQTYSMINFSDGAILKCQTREQLVEMLNDGEYKPESLLK